MKASFVVLVAAAAVAQAVDTSPGLPPGTPIDCLKPNANFCQGGDIILRCNGSAIGYPGRCSDNINAEPPLGGTATCWESAEKAGDAGCEKNCVVYGSGQQPFTLPADKCTPTYTASPSYSAPSTDTASPTYTAPTSDTSSPAYTSSPSYSSPASYSPPASYSSSPPSSASPSYSASTKPVWITTTTNLGTLPGHEVSTSIGCPPPTSNSPPPASNSAPPPPPVSSGSPTNQSTLPPTTSSPQTVPTGAAVANQVGGLLLVAGVIAAYLA